MYAQRQRESCGKMLAFSDYIAKSVQKFYVPLLQLFSISEVFQNKMPEVLQKWKIHGKYSAPYMAPSKRSMNLDFWYSFWL